MAKTDEWVEAMRQQRDLDGSDGDAGLPPGAISWGMPRQPDLLSNGSTRVKIRREPGPRFPFPVPNGWFIVAASGDVAPGQVIPLHYFGKDLALFRSADGIPHVVSAYCAHLGAHLAVGGRVDGEGLRCPFHGWCYDGESGRCVDIPYGSHSGKVPSQAKVRAFPTLERNRMIWAWFHLEGGPPFYEVPEVGEIEDPGWSEPHTIDFVIDTVCQEMAENNHDPAHFRFVHGTDDIPDEEVHIEGSYKKVVSLGGVSVRETFGLGLGVLRYADFVTFFSSTTPIDREGVHVRWTFMTPVANGPKAAQKAAEAFLAGVSQDVPIWENKRYVERPIIIKDERTILDHREWCQQFYSDPAAAID